VVFGAGCSPSSSDDSAKLRVEVESMKVELARLKAESEGLRADLSRIGTALNAQKERGKASLASRFDAAMTLIDVNQKQAALAKLTLDAAEVGDAETTKKCVENLIEVNLKQEVIYKSALRLAKADKGKDAVTLARSLVDVNQQQKALSKIANGDYQD
jgi:hypothetical protein